jgi:hypothetical protein
MLRREKKRLFVATFYFTAPLNLFFLLSLYLLLPNSIPNLFVIKHQKEREKKGCGNKNQENMIM